MRRLRPSDIKKRDRFYRHRFHSDDLVDQAVKEVLNKLYEKQNDGTRIYKGKIPGMDYNYWKNKKKDKFENDLIAGLDSVTGQDGLDQLTFRKYKALGVPEEEAIQIMKDNGAFRFVSKREAKAGTKRLKDDETVDEKSLHALHKMVNKNLNLIVDNQFIFYSGRELMVVADFNKHHMREHYFVHTFSEDINSPKSIISTVQDTFNVEDRFYFDWNFRRKKYRGKVPQWFKSPYYLYPELNLFNGGFVQPEGATWRKHDQIPCILCANEFVFTQEAVRGAGRGSYYQGGAFLYALMDYYEREAKKYGHKR